MTTPTTVQVRFQFRADTAANWTTIDPVLLANELGRETDTGKIKIGDGTTAWSSLAYQGWSSLTYPLVNADIDAAAAIDHSKLANITAGSVLLGNASNVPTATALSGDVTVNSSGVTAIGSGVIVDADVSATAEIAVSKLANGSANQILTTDGTNVSWTDSPTIAGNVIISGNLTVNGTETVINVETLQVEDHQIEIGNVTTPSDLTADNGGIVLKGATDKTILWVDSTDSWTSSENVDLASGKTYKIAGTDVLSATTLGSAVVNSSLTSVGNLTDLTVDTDTLVVDATNDLVGIGTASPGDYNGDGDDLVIAGSGNKGITISSTSGGTSRVYFADGTTGTEPVIGSIRYQHSNNSLNFATNATDRLTIDSSGRLLVGGSNSFTVNSTDSALQIQGTSANAASASIQRYQNNANPPFLYFAKSRGTTVGAAGAVADNDLIGGIRFNADDGTDLDNQAAAIEARVDGTPATGSMPGELLFSTNDGTVDATPTTRMTIKSDGNVGIGTSAPDELLHIEGDAAEFKGTNTNAIADTAGTEQVFKFGVEGQRNGVYGPAGSIIFRQDGNTWSSVDQYNKPTRIEFCTQDASSSDNSETPRLVIDKNGQVGIGTTSPSEILHLNGTNPFILIQADSTTGNSGFNFSDGTNRGQILYDHDGDYMRFSTAGSSNERLRIDSSGRLLVGTSSASTLRTNIIPKIQTEATSATENGISLFTNVASASGPFLIFGKSRGTTAGSNTVVQDNDVLGALLFVGADGTDRASYGASITARVDGTPGANDMPGRLEFHTTAATESSPTERLRISSDGAIGLSGANYGTSGQVLTSNGSSSAPTWQDAGAGAGLFTSYALIRDQKADTTDGGTFTSGAWQTRDLNTEVADPDSIVTIASNQFTLSTAGSYLIKWGAPAVNANRSQTRLYDVTNTAAVGYGQNQFFTTTTNNTGFSRGAARVTITGSTTYEIQHQCQSTTTNNGFGEATSFGGVEVYTEVEIYLES